MDKSGRNHKGYYRQKSIKIITMDRRRIFFIFFLVMMTLIITQPASAAASQPDNQTPLVAMGQFVITDVSPAQGNPGDLKTVTITIKNINPEETAYSVSMLIKPENVDYVQIEGGLEKYGTDQVLPADSFRIQYTISIKENTPKGIYYIPITCVWSTDKAGTLKNQEDLNFGIDVIDNPELVKIDTTKIITVPTQIYPGDVFKVNISLKNSGSNNISQIRAILTTDKPFSSVGASSEQYLPLLTSGETGIASFNLQVDKQGQSRLYNFNLSLQYVDNFNRIQTQQSNFGINVEELSGVYIQNARLDPTSLYPGTEGLLQVQIANAGTNTVENVRIPISGGDKILTQSQNFIGILSPGASTAETVSYGVLVSRETDPGNYGMNIQINYDDLTGMHFSQSNLYIVKVNEPSSVIPIPQSLLQMAEYALIFIVISYGIFLYVGYRTEKEQNPVKEDDDERTQ
jgi:hypothetical protein